MEWSRQQGEIRDWFRAPRRHLIVRARAGTGKTTTLRGAIDVIEGPVRILYLAFGKDIAADAKGSIKDPRVEIKTFHSALFAVVRRHWNVKAEDDVEWDRIDAAEPGIPREMAGLTRKLVGLAKNIKPFGRGDELVELGLDYGVDVDPDWEGDGWTLARVAGVAERVLELSLVRDAEGRISFDDMIYLPTAHRWIRPTYDWVLVDEFQDTNAVQGDAALALCKPNGHVIGIGDDRQGIYGFRGADVGALDRLKERLDADELGLTVTYRCPRAVVARAKVLVPDFEAHPTAPEGEVTELYIGELGAQVQPGDAVLSRTNAPLVSVCLGLVRRGTPAKIKGRDVGKALANLVRKLATQNSVPAFLQRLQHWTETEKTRARARAKTERKADQLCSDIEERYQTLVELSDGAASIAEILARCERMFADVREGERQALVVCSSVHKAKGLEWDTVYLLAWTLYCNGARRGDPEEANIDYTATTRAKRVLVLVTDKVIERAAPMLYQAGPVLGAEAQAPGRNVLVDCARCDFRGVIGIPKDNGEPWPECPRCEASAWAVVEDDDAEVAVASAGPDSQSEPQAGDDDGQLHLADRDPRSVERDARDRGPIDGERPARGDAGGDVPGVPVELVAEGQEE